MLVICDNSTLSALAEIGLIHLLPQLLGRVTIPAAVHREAVHPSAPPALRDWIAHPPAWLTVEPDPSCLLEETKCLGPGEAAAITIAWHHRGTSGLIIDEKRGRALAKSLGLPVSLLPVSGSRPPSSSRHASKQRNPEERPLGMRHPPRRG